MDGDFAMLESEVAGVIRLLRQNGINVLAVHSRMLGEEPRMIFLHDWGEGKAREMPPRAPGSFGGVGQTRALGAWTAFGRTRRKGIWFPFPSRDSLRWENNGYGLNAPPSGLFGWRGAWVRCRLTPAGGRRSDCRFRGIGRIVATNQIFGDVDALVDVVNRYLPVVHH